MFEKLVCEEIISDKDIKLVFSDDITNAYYQTKELNENRIIRTPICYFDEYSLHKTIFKPEIGLRYIIHRLHDCMQNQTFYFISIFSPNINGYDEDFIQFITDAAKYPRYNYEVYFTYHFIRKYPLCDNKDEIVFIIDLEKPISKEYIMNRDYRVELDFINKVSFLSDYKEELHTIDQEG